jgi:uncharacterized repeat protein (TIGR03803 family)
MNKLYFSTLVLLFLISGTGKAQFSLMHIFNDTNGEWPFGTLTLSGTKLYGTTYAGGAHGDGNIFSINTDGSGYKDMLDFNGTNGSGCNSPLILSGNLLYGMTAFGGTNSDGVIFSIDTNGSGYTVLFNFNYVNGAFPYGALTLSASGSVLYGTTAWGGAIDSGCVFSINTNGSGYKDLLDFDWANGRYASGALVLSGNTLYDMTERGGANGKGLIFSIDTNGSGYKDLLDFNGVNGANPEGNVTLSGGILYGAAFAGGANGDGLIFSVNTNGSGYKDIFDFDGINGANPENSSGSLILSGNRLFGETQFGGTHNYGVVFSIDTNGAGYKTLFNFDSLNGSGPEGALTLSGNMIYGATGVGGIYNAGVIFSLDTLGCLNNYNQDICIVTTDTAINKNVIIWDRNNVPPDSTHSFINIYDSTVSGWKKIATVSDTALSEYIDTASNPSAQSYSYKISTVDSCGESSLSPFNSTIYLQVALLANRDSLYWTPYVGFATPQYLIYRGLSLNALTLIDSVSGGTFNYVDTLPPAGSMYLVEAINPSGGCVPTHRRILHPHKSASSLSLSNGGVPKKPTGIASITSPLSSVKIIPNPNNGLFQLGIRNYRLGNNTTVKIYNMLGEQVYSQLNVQHATLSIDLSSQSNGVYLYRVLTETGDLISQGKLIISR